MKKPTSFENLVGRARLEEHGSVDVADAVLSRLAVERRIQRVSYRPLAWIATFSSAAAACVGVAALWWLRTNSAEPMTELYEAISWVVQ